MACCITLISSSVAFDKAFLAQHRNPRSPDETVRNPGMRRSVPPDFAAPHPGYDVHHSSFTTSTTPGKYTIIKIGHFYASCETFAEDVS